MRRRVLTACVAGLLGLAVVPSSPAAGAEKFTFFGDFGAAAFCDGSGIVPRPSLAARPDIGFAIIRATGNGNIKATIKFDFPGTYVTIRLIQGPADCHTVDLQGFTDELGSTIQLTEDAV